MNGNSGFEIGGGFALSVELLRVSRYEYSARVLLLLRAVTRYVTLLLTVKALAFLY